jgi:hypothetical protein
MANALSDVVAEELSRSYVEQRVVDWANRIEELFEQIEQWLPAGWRAERRGGVLMDEELMRRHGVPARELPQLHLAASNRVTASVIPTGLWVIGANGRLDFRTPAGQFAIVDKAETDLNRANPPHWVIAPLRDRLRARDLTEEALREALAA